MIGTSEGKVADPMKFAREFWPDVKFYRKQRELMYSLMDCDETICVAGNMLGKDFTAGFLVLWFFLSRNPCRVITTSVDSTQLESVLWGEIKRFISTSTHKSMKGVRGVLNSTEGGPIVVNHLHLRKIVEGRICDISYVRGRVAAQGEGMLGHHVADTGDGIPRTLLIADEASGVDDTSWEVASSWAKRKFAIGNPYPTSNFFYRGWKECQQGDIKSEDGLQTYRKLITIRAEDSPNVQLGFLQERAGTKPTGEMVVDGVLPYHEYRKRRKTWDVIKQTIGLDARFWEGAEMLMFPPDWLDAMAQYAWKLMGKSRTPKALGCDPAEGGDRTAFCLIDEFGINFLESLKTVDTSRITDKIIDYIKKYGLDSNNVCLDSGGGGKQIADELRRRGYKVRAVAFGEAVTKEEQRVKKKGEKIQEKEERYVYKNRRAQMYHLLREMMDVTMGKYFGIPAAYSGLRSELSPIPMLYDDEGRIYLPPKRNTSKNKEKKQKSLVEIIGHSPDEADALVLACYALTFQKKKIKVGGYKVGIMKSTRE